MASPTINYDHILLSRYWDQTFETGYCSTPLNVRFTAVRDRITKESGLWISAQVPPKEIDFDIPVISGFTSFWVDVKIEIVSDIGTVQSSVTIKNDTQGDQILLQQAQRNTNAMTVRISITARNEITTIATVGLVDVPIRFTTYTVSANEFPSDPGTPVVSLASVDGYPTVGNYTHLGYYKTMDLGGFIGSATIRCNFNRYTIPFEDSNFDFIGISNPRLALSLDDGYNSNKRAGLYRTNIEYASDDIDEIRDSMYFSCNQQYPVHMVIKVDGAWHSCGVKSRVYNDFEILSKDYIVPAAVQSITVNAPEVILLTDPPQKVFYYLKKDPRALGEINNKAVDVEQTNPAVCSISKNEADSVLEITPLATGNTMITITTYEYDKYPIPNAKFELYVSTSYEVSQFILPYDRLNVSLESKIIATFEVLQDSYYHEPSYQEMPFDGYSHDVRTIYSLLTKMGDNINLFASRFLIDNRSNDQYKLLVSVIRIHYSSMDYYVKRANELVSWNGGYKNPDDSTEAPNWYVAINSLIECLRIIGNVNAYPNSVVDGCYVDFAHVDREPDEP